MDSNKGKILLTGGLGYIGAHTAVVMAKAGYDLLIIDNLSNTHENVLNLIKMIVSPDAKIEFMNVDIREKARLEKVFEKHTDIGGVIHFAGKKAVGESCADPFLYYENNLVGSINLFQLMDKYNIKNLVFSSSATVYDAQKLLPPFVEGDRLGTYNPYGTTKLMLEYMIRDLAMHKGFNAINLRYFNPVGAHESGLIGEDPKGVPNNLLPFALKVATGEIEKLQVFGDDYETEDGTGVRDYIHVMDLADAHLLAYEYLLNPNDEIEQESPWKQWIQGDNIYEVFNIGIGDGKSVMDIITLVKDITGVELNYELVERRSGDIATSIANPQKAKKVLGREAKRSIYQAVEDSWRFMENKG